MPRRHVNNQSPALTLDHAIKGLGHDLVVLALDEGRPHMLGVAHERFFGLLDCGHLAAIFPEAEHFGLIFLRVGINLL